MIVNDQELALNIFLGKHSDYKDEYDNQEDIDIKNLVDSLIEHESEIVLSAVEIFYWEIANIVKENVNPISDENYYNLQGPLNELYGIHSDEYINIKKLGILDEAYNVIYDYYKNEVPEYLYLLEYIDVRKDTFYKNMVKFLSEKYGYA